MGFKDNSVYLRQLLKYPFSMTVLLEIVLLEFILIYSESVTLILLRRQTLMK